MLPSVSDNEAPTKWAKAIYTLGVPAVIALFLVYAIRIDVKADLTDIKREIASHDDKMGNYRGASASEQQAIRFYLRTICINTSKTELQIKSCLDIANPMR